MPDHIPDPVTRVSRRDFLKITAVAGSFLAGSALLRRRDPVPTVHETRLLMGTVVNLSLVADDPAHARRTAAATFAEMERLIEIFDHRRPHGPLGRLNREGRLSPAPVELLELIAEAVTYGEVTQGAFDITAKPMVEALRAGRAAAPGGDYRAIRLTGGGVELTRPGMALTLDGIGKGRVVDAAAAVLARQGYGDVLVEAGGDLLAGGRRPGDEAWRVGIDHPRSAGRLLATLHIGNRALATSGDYAHAFTRDFARHHIVDPRTGRSPAALAAGTVLAPTATAADALSTAVMVLGPTLGLTLLERLPHVEGVLVTKKLELLPTAGMPV